jgi:hypothetical protein
MRNFNLFSLRSATIATFALLGSAALAQAPNPLQQRPAVRQIPPATAPATAAPAPAPATAAKPKAAASGDFKARRTQCSQEWKTAKTNNTTGGDKWPQFFSKCNTRLKAQGV